MLQKIKPLQKNHQIYMRSRTLDAKIIIILYIWVFMQFLDLYRFKNKKFKITKI